MFHGFRYFHRAPRRSKDASRSLTSLTGYRGGSRKGLDLTIGGPLASSVSPYFSQSVGSDKTEQDTNNQTEDGGLLRGGVLLRSLREIPKDASSATGSSKVNLVSGPSLLVDKILELSGASSISDLVEELWGGDRSAFNPRPSSRKSHLYLKSIADSSSKLSQIHKSPRIGLDLSHPGTTVPISESKLMDLHPRVRFLPKMYRYMIKPEELGKGRGQTFYGFIHAILGTRSNMSDRTLSGDKDLRAALVSNLGIKNDAVKKYLLEYEAGRDKGLKHLERCIGHSGKGMAVSPSSYLSMMGALDAVMFCASKIGISTEEH